MESKRPIDSDNLLFLFGEEHLQGRELGYFQTDGRIRLNDDELNGKL